MLIECEKFNYQSKFSLMQIEITGKCNMKCEHCRAWKDPQDDIDPKTFSNILDFVIAESHNEMTFILSGGEPFLHNNIFSMINEVNYKFEKEKKVKPRRIVITSNGYFINKKIAQELKEINNGKLCVQISLDYPDEKKHDSFRNTKNAYKKALRAIKLLVENDIFTVVRMTVVPDNIDCMEEMIELCKKNKVSGVSFEAAISVGRSNDEKLLIKAEKKKNFLKKVIELSEKHKDLQILNEEPCKVAIYPDKILEDYEKSDNKEGVFGGCSAGINNINILSNGDVTPCAMLPFKIINVKGKTHKEILNKYTKSEIIKNLVERNVKGACGSCKFKRFCGGCRASAYALTGDYLEEDKTCWLCK